MTVNRSRIAAGLASAAAFCMAASPAMAQSWGGWGGGWNGGWGRHDRVDAGDVLTGILVIGGIAAIASAIKSEERNRRGERGDGHPRERNSGYGNDYGNGNDQQWQQGSGIDSAVDRCSNEVSRGTGRVQAVESINRDGDGWRVQGRTAAGKSFSCSVDGSGQIRNVQVDGHAY